MIKDRFFYSNSLDGLECTIKPEDIVSPVKQDEAPSLTQLILKAANGSLSLSDYRRSGGEYDDDDEFDVEDDFDPRSADIVELENRRDMLYSQLEEQDKLAKLKKSEVDNERTDTTEGEQPDKSEQ